MHPSHIRRQVPTMAAPDAIRYVCYASNLKIRRGALHAACTKGERDAFVATVHTILARGIMGAHTYYAEGRLSYCASASNIRGVGYQYVAVADRTFDNQQTFALLDALRDLHVERGGHAIPKQRMRECMARYNALGAVTPSSLGASRERIALLQTDVDTARTTMYGNIEAVLERGEKLEGVLLGAEQLRESAAQFDRTARKIKRVQSRAKCKLCVLLVCVLLAAAVLALGIAAMACGGLDQLAQCRRLQTNDTHALHE